MTQDHWPRGVQVRVLQGVQAIRRQGLGYNDFRCVRMNTDSAELVTAVLIKSESHEEEIAASQQLTKGIRPQPFYGDVSEWLKEHAWKVCIPQKGIESSNLSVSAYFFQCHQILPVVQPYICLITNKQPITMANNKFQKESREVKPRYEVDKYGLLVNAAMSEKDESAVRQILNSLQKKAEAKANPWPTSPNGMPWCESC